MSRKITLLLSACSVLTLVAACGPLNDQTDYQSNAVGSRAETSEDILAAQGSWNMIEEEQQAGDPVNLHSSARKKVNPSNRSKRQFIPEERLADVQRPSGEEDVHFRLIRMEREVKDLRDDFDKLLPPLSNLIVADSALDSTIKEIQARPRRKPPVPQDYSDASVSVYNDTGIASEQLLGNRRKTSAPVMKPAEEVAQRTASMRAPVPLSTTAAPAAMSPRAAPAAMSPRAAPAQGKAVVQDMRMGEHPGKTRLVLDLTGETKYRADLDNDEHLLTIELSEAGWSGAPQKMFNHPLIKGYTTQASANGGTILALELKKNAKVLGSSALKPNTQYGNRIYLDLAAS